MIITLEDAIKKYGKIENGKWLDEGKWCSPLLLPKPLASKLINSATGLPTTKIYCNADIHEPLYKVFLKIIGRGLVPELETFDGCFMIRSVRGDKDSPSTHSYALALDFNAKVNVLGSTPTMSPDVVACFKEEGFSWGGDFKRRDGMHFSRAWE